MFSRDHNQCSKNANLIPIEAFPASVLNVATAFIRGIFPTRHRTTPGFEMRVNDSAGRMRTRQKKPTHQRG